MRRLIASIALAGLAVVLAAPFAGAATKKDSMACCHGGGKMICCAPSARCEMKSCPPADRDAVLPGLPPAVLEPAPARAARTPRFEDLAPERLAASSLASDPPDRPPRG